jgi:hypothetical protein
MIKGGEREMDEKEEIRVGNVLTGNNISVIVGKNEYYGFLRAMSVHNLSIAKFFNEVIDPIVKACWEEWAGQV